MRDANVARGDTKERNQRGAHSDSQKERGGSKAREANGAGGKDGERGAPTSVLTAQRAAPGQRLLLLDASFGDGGLEGVLVKLGADGVHEVQGGRDAICGQGRVKEEGCESGPPETEGHGD